MWTPTTRQQHSRTVTRYQTDLTDAEWHVIAPHLPKPCATGRPREWPMREIINGIFYVMRAGCPWRLVPRDLPPWGTIYRWFAVWRDDGSFERINHALVMADRERVGRDASPTAAIIDSQSAKTTEAGGPRGYDAGKKINGRKRHALVDTDGRGLVLEPHPASIQDRDGGGPLLRVSRRIFPFIQRVFADSGYAGEKVTTATLIAVEIVRKNPDQIGFAVNPRRWVVERFFAWIGRNRRLAKDFEGTIDSARAFLYAASVMLLLVGSLVLHDFRNRLLEPAHVRVRRDPFGVTLIIGAWNEPFMLLFGPLVAALAGGNVAVLKPSELAAACSAAAAKLVPKTAYFQPMSYTELSMEEERLGLMVVMRCRFGDFFF
jgi:transposase